MQCGVPKDRFFLNPAFPTESTPTARNRTNEMSAVTVTRAANLMSRPRRDPVEIGLLALGVVVMVVVLVLNTVAFVPADERIEPTNREELTVAPQSVELAARSAQRQAAGRDFRFEIHRSDDQPKQQLVLGESAGVTHIFSMERTESLTATGTREGKPRSSQGFAPPATIDSSCGESFITPALPAPPVKDIAGPESARVDQGSFWHDVALGLQRWFPGIGSIVERFMASI